MDNDLKAWIVIIALLVFAPGVLVAGAVLLGMAIAAVPVLLLGWSIKQSIAEAFAPPLYRIGEWLDNKLGRDIERR